MSLPFSVFQVILFGAHGFGPGEPEPDSLLSDLNKPVPQPRSPGRRTTAFQVFLRALGGVHSAREGPGQRQDSWQLSSFPALLPHHCPRHSLCDCWLLAWFCGSGSRDTTNSCAFGRQNTAMVGTGLTGPLQQRASL